MEQQTWLTGIALQCCDRSERWFPDTYVFAALGVIAVELLAVVRGSPPPRRPMPLATLLESDPVHHAEVFHHTVLKFPSRGSSLLFYQSISRLAYRATRVQTPF
jgi:hypothetical protein